MSAPPLLTLCMIVKDEAHGIARTLRSAKPWIDRWCILDTGSTDGTPEIVARELEGVPGMAWGTVFEDFARTRNVLLEKACRMGCQTFEDWRTCEVHATCGELPEFLLLLDADDVLEGGEALRGFLKCQAGWTKAHDREAFYLRMSEGACEWSSARVVRASAVGPEGWHYVGAVHEVLVHPSGRVPTITIPGVSIRHDRGAVSAERLQERLARDVRLLAFEVGKDPTNARATFYLAQTFKRMGRGEDALRWFRRRVELGGWREEVFESMLEAARLETFATNKVDGLLAAHAFSPHRAEPLVDLADHFRAREQHGPAFTFARRAFELVHPEADVLFVDRDCYAWKAADRCAISAWYLGEWGIGEQAARNAFDQGPEAERERLARNLRFYEERRVR